MRQSWNQHLMNPLSTKGHKHIMRFEKIQNQRNSRLV